MVVDQGVIAARTTQKQALRHRAADRLCKGHAKKFMATPLVFMATPLVNARSAAGFLVFALARPAIAITAVGKKQQRCRALGFARDQFVGRPCRRVATHRLRCSSFRTNTSTRTPLQSRRLHANHPTTARVCSLRAANFQTRTQTQLLTDASLTDTTY
jgi:hypothetical protein